MSLVKELIDLYRDFREDRTKAIVYMSGCNTDSPEWFSMDFLHSDKSSLRFYESGGFETRDIEIFKDSVSRVLGKGWEVVFAKKIPEDLPPECKKRSKIKTEEGNKLFSFQSLDKKDIEYLLREGI